MRTFTVALLALALVGCQGRPADVPTTKVTAAFVGLEDLRTDALARLERGDLDGALRALHEAAARAPEDVNVLYLFGVVNSRLDRHDQAALAFRAVLAHGAPRSAEVEAARRWLAEAGALPEASEPAATTDESASAPAGRIEGRTEWPRAGEQALPKLQILLVGTEGETRGRRYAARVDLNDPYTIADVRAGAYTLMAQVGSTRLWEQAVSVEDGKTVKVDLTPATAVAQPDALKPLP